MNLRPIKEPNKTDYFLVLLMVLYAGVGNPIFRDVRYSIIPIIIAFIVYLHRGVKFTKNARNIYIVSLLFIIAYFIKYGGEFDPMFSYRIFVYITFPYLIISVVKYNFFKIYENIIYVMALISLPMFLLQATAYSTTLALLTKFQSILQIPPMENWKEYANVIFFTINRGSDLSGGALRNCGFAWEPGGFSNFLIVAIIINLARNKFNYKKNTNLWVLLLTFITTFSTTGFLAFGFVMLWFFYNSNIKKKMILFPIFFALTIYSSTLSFMTEKIENLSSNPQAILDEVAHRSYITGNSYSIGRFAGFLMNLKDFKEHPVIGYGGHSEETWQQKNNISVASINGLGRWLAMFGSIGMAIFLFAYIKSFQNLAKLYNFKKPILLLGTILTLGFGFGLIQSGLFFGLMLSYWILPANKLIKIQDNSI